MNRSHSDRCPGVLRPWIAEDGALIRLRLVGGAMSTTSLRALIDIADQHADGTILLTKRTNVQLRGIQHHDGHVPDAVVDALTEAGFVPSRSHELIRNIMVSPLTGRAGGQADLRSVATELDRSLCADPAYAALAGRFLFVLDDGRGDVANRPLDLGLMAVDKTAAQLRVGAETWGPIVELADAAEALVAYAARFLAATADADEAPWHVDELPEGGTTLIGDHFARDVRTQVTSLPMPHGIITQDDGRRAEHVAVPDGLLDGALVDRVLARVGTEVIVTPWRSLVIPDLENP